jgi:predicted O-linked N-acetylglucosamine transferase (SPINDLY family)
MAAHAPTPSEIARLQSALAQRNLAEAATIARRWTRRYPKSHFCWNALGGVLGMVGRLEDSLESLQRAHALAPLDVQVLGNLGATFGRLGRLAEAVDCFRKVVAMAPHHADAHCRLGTALALMGRIAEAEPCFRHAICLQPDHAIALNNLGCALQRMDRARDAEVCHRAALKVRPDFGEAWQQLGNALLVQGEIAQAQECHRAALRVRPDLASAHSDLLLCLNYDQISARDYLAEAQRYGAMVRATVAQPFKEWNCPEQGGPLRVGLVSGDLRRHPVGYFLMGVLAQLDPSRIELYAYSTGHESDGLTTLMRPSFKVWRSLAGTDDDAAARLIHADGVQVLVDLSGHTALNRLPLFSRRPAPVQVSWLGYFASTGLSEIDYLVADRICVPEAHRGDYAERIWHMPDTRLCFSPPDDAPDAGDLPARSNGFVTFCCFNNIAKMNQAVVATWSRVLAGLPGSRLFLKARHLSQESVRESVVARFARCGIPAERLVMEGPSAREEYLASYRRADIALDPFPFTGGTTTAESLWMGVPVLTLAGDRLVARQGASLMTNAGLSDWVVGDIDQYVRRAVELAADTSGLAALRARLRRDLVNTPIFDSPRFARNLESALQSMWNENRSRS